MKKFTTFLLAAVMCLSLCIPALAAETSYSTDAQRLKQAEAIAYMDLDSASGAMQARILEARNTIIYSKSWVANGATGRILDRDGNVYEELPQFTDIFPSDWAVPLAETSPIAVQSEYDWNPFFNDNINLKKPPTTGGTPAFCSFDTYAFPDTEVEYYVEHVMTSAIYQNITVDATYNCGYTNKATGKSYGYALYIKNGYTYEIDPPSKIRLQVHASTNDHIGEWSIRVDGKRIFVNK